MLNVELDFDHDPESPNEWWQWTLHSFNRRHGNFLDPVGLINRDGTGATAKMRRKLESGLAFVLGYFEHGNSVWFLADEPPLGVEFRWDGVRVAGLLEFAGDGRRAPRSYEERRKWARDYLRTYTQWANGEVYWFQATDEDGETVASCGSLYGPDDVVHCLQDSIDGKLSDVEIQWTGPAAFLMERVSLG